MESYAHKCNGSSRIKIRPTLNYLKTIWKQNCEETVNMTHHFVAHFKMCDYIIIWSNEDLQTWSVWIAYSLFQICNIII